MITTDTLLDISREDVKKELIGLEKMIDDHIYKYYTQRNTQIPGIEIEPLRDMTKYILIKTYEYFGWNIYFELTENRNIQIMYIKQLDDTPVPIVSHDKFKQSLRL